MSTQVMTTSHDAPFQGVMRSVEARFLTQVPNSPLKDSQRLVIRRADAEAALGDLAALVRGLAAS